MGSLSLTVFEKPAMTPANEGTSPLGRGRLELTCSKILLTPIAHDTASLSQIFYLFEKERDYKQGKRQEGSERGRVSSRLQAERGA